MTTVRIPNQFGEELDVWMEGNPSASQTIIFVHGFATDKHETAHYFDDLAKSLAEQHRIVRFDFSGCGLSQGRLEDIDYQKQAGELNKIIEYCRQSFSGKFSILAQSMGTFVTSLLCPAAIDRAFFTGVPNSNVDFMIQRILNRFGSRPGAVVNLNGVSLFPRSSGVTQKIGPSFWRVLKDFKPVDAISRFAAKTKLLIIHPKQDDVVGVEFMDEYAQIPQVTIEWIDGDHSFTKREDRTALIRLTKAFFETGD